MISEFLIIASICGIALGLTACCIILFANKTHVHANRLLAASLFCLVVIMAVTFLLEWNSDYYAYVYRFPSPLVYLFVPVAYLYLRSTLNGETHFKQWDWLHFLPAALHLLEMLPFYLSSLEHKKELAGQVALDPDKLIALDEGMLPSYFHTAIRFVQGSIYMYFMYRVLKKNSKAFNGYYGKATRQVFHWLLSFTCLIGVLAIPLIFFFVFPKTFFVQGTLFLLMMITCSFLAINLYLFFRPQILYGISGNSYEDTTVSKTSEPISQPASISLENYKPVLEKYMADEKPFLKQGYSISDLSAETGIPLHHLSALLNRVYEMRFTDFLNRMRINYIRENSHNAEWEQLTLEGIAKQAGFNSRTTFFNVIKKTTGTTPSEFMASMKEKVAE